VDLTTSYEQHLPVDVLARYQFAEVRNAAAIIASTNPVEFAQLVAALQAFRLLATDLTTPGGQESNLAARLNTSFRSQGWREARVDTNMRLSLVTMPYAPAGEHAVTVVDTETNNEGYKVDNFKARVALDVEWNAKDGNLDRDIGAYRALYDNALIDGAVIVSRTQSDLRELAYLHGTAAGMTHGSARKILGTTTTTNSDKLVPRMTRGDSGGCPLLAVFISAASV
jgi:hypothetical protein